jgi:hypothetical protein
MRLTIAIAVVLASLCFAPASAQIRQWVDEKGTIHYEATGPARPTNAGSLQPKANARKLIERNHGGLRLGDDESAFTATHNKEKVETNNPEGNYYRYSGPLPEGARQAGAFFVDGRLALILIEYDLGFGSWQPLINQTSEKYGPPAGDSQTAVWNDGVTALTLRHESTGSVTILLEDQTAMSKYADRLRAALPKF